jgi:hypothetical protein
MDNYNEKHEHLLNLCALGNIQSLIEQFDALSKTEIEQIKDSEKARFFNF